MLAPALDLNAIFLQCLTANHRHIASAIISQRNDVREWFKAIMQSCDPASIGSKAYIRANMHFLTPQAQALLCGFSVNVSSRFFTQSAAASTDTANGVDLKTPSEVVKIPSSK